MSGKTGSVRPTIGARLDKIEGFLDSNLHWEDKQLLVELERIFMRG